MRLDFEPDRRLESDAVRAESKTAGPDGFFRPAVSNLQLRR
jgi:hypothetical protein